MTAAEPLGVPGLPPAHLLTAAEYDRPVSLLAHHIAEGFGHADSGTVTGVFATTSPFPIQLQLDRLR